VGCVVGGVGVGVGHRLTFLTADCHRRREAAALSLETRRGAGVAMRGCELLMTEIAFEGGYRSVTVMSRHVPVHILHLALKYGRRARDPQRVQGAFPYTIKMLKNGKEYALEIVVREKDWTILHFLFK
jgi:hypothetical protein